MGRNAFGMTPLESTRFLLTGKLIGGWAPEPLEALLIGGWAPEPLEAFLALKNEVGVDNVEVLGTSATSATFSEHESVDGITSETPLCTSATGEQVVLQLATQSVTA